jgi:hypothetical protein
VKLLEEMSTSRANETDSMERNAFIYRDKYKHCTQSRKARKN